MKIIESMAIHTLNRLQETYSNELELGSKKLSTDKKDIIEQKLLLIHNFLNQFTLYVKGDS
jgi:hypothetical protein